jgi:hypothetical protein
MMMEENLLNKTMIIGITLLLTIAIMFFTVNSLDGFKANAQQPLPLQKQTISSIPHNAKGHQSHQIVNFQNQTDDIIYKGIVVFNSTAPVDIISYSNLNDKNATPSVKIWEVGNKKLIPKTLLKNSTNGTVAFEGNGVLAHTTQSNSYKVTFTINDSSTNRTPGTIVLGPLSNIFR